MQLFSMQTPQGVAACVFTVMLSPAVHAGSEGYAISGQVMSGASIKGVFESALASNPDLQAYQKRLDASRARRSAANSLTAQPLTVEGSYRSDRNHNDQGLREVELGFSAPLWNWNERSRTQVVREVELEALSLQLNHQKLELAGEVRRLYWDTLSAHLDVEIAKARADATLKLANDVKRRFNAGELAKTDLYQAKGLQAQALSELGRAQSLLAIADAEFSSLTGLPADVVGGVNALEHARSHEHPNAEKLSTEAHSSGPVVNTNSSGIHPALQLAQSQLELQTRQLDLIGTQSRANPEVGLALVSDRSQFNTGSEKSLILSTRIPLGRAAEYQSRVLDAQANQSVALAQLAKTEKALLARTQAAKRSLNMFAELQEMADEQARLTRQVYDLYRKSFDLGETDLPTLLRYEQQAFEADRLAIKSHIEYAAKVSAFKQAQGVLPE
jgi:cobalt-zinc-cadmium efflux system outer membrane protein